MSRYIVTTYSQFYPSIIDTLILTPTQNLSTVSIITYEFLLTIAVFIQTAFKSIHAISKTVYTCTPNRISHLQMCGTGC